MRHVTAPLEGSGFSWYGMQVLLSEALRRLMMALTAGLYPKSGSACAVGQRLPDVERDGAQARDDALVGRLRR